MHLYRIFQKIQKNICIFTKHFKNCRKKYYISFEYFQTFGNNSRKIQRNAKNALKHKLISHQTKIFDSVFEMYRKLSNFSKKIEIFQYFLKMKF